MIARKQLCCRVEENNFVVPLLQIIQKCKLVKVIVPHICRYGLRFGLSKRLSLEDYISASGYRQIAVTAPEKAMIEEESKPSYWNMR